MMGIHSKIPSEKYYCTHICNNGHEQRENDNKYCPDCGAGVINSCQCCRAIIKRGIYEEEPVFLNPYDPEELSGFEHYKIPFKNFEIPNYCHECGKAYPWTEKFLSRYKLILELRADEIDEAMQDKIYNATEEMVKNKFTGNSITIFKLITNKLPIATQSILLNTLNSIATTEVMELLKNI